MPRATMSALIARVKALANGDAQISDDDYQQLLDDHAFVVECALEPRPPFYTQHRSPFENLETGCAVYVGYNTLLDEDTDYTIDLQRGIVTTPAANYQVIYLQGMAYDVYAAAADAWERIAARHVGKFDLSADGSSLRRSQLHEQALAQAAACRRQAWATTVTTERSDTAGDAAAQAAQRLDAFRRTFR